MKSLDFRNLRHVARSYDCWGLLLWALQHFDCVLEFVVHYLLAVIVHSSLEFLSSWNLKRHSGLAQKLPLWLLARCVHYVIVLGPPEILHSFVHAVSKLGLAFADLDFKDLNRCGFAWLTGHMQRLMASKHLSWRYSIVCAVEILQGWQLVWALDFLGIRLKACLVVGHLTFEQPVELVWSHKFRINPCLLAWLAWIKRTNNLLIRFFLTLNDGLFVV